MKAISYGPGEASAVTGSWLDSLAVLYPLLRLYLENRNYPTLRDLIFTANFVPLNVSPYPEGGHIMRWGMTLNGIYYYQYSVGNVYFMAFSK